MRQCDAPLPDGNGVWNRDDERPAGTVPIFVSAKMGRSPSPRFASRLLLVTQESVQSPRRSQKWETALSPATTR